VRVQVPPPVEANKATVRTGPQLPVVSMGREAGLERSPGDSASAAIAKPARPQGEQVKSRLRYQTI
jgi:hypothetical protein